MRIKLVKLTFLLFFLGTSFAKECEEEFLVFDKDYEKGLAPEGK